MQRSDIILFLGTFLFGMFTGTYLFYVGWQPNFNLPTSNKDLANTSSIQVIAEQYGDCTISSTGCATFRIAEDRSYRLIYIDNEGGVANSREGKISSNLWDYFIDALEHEHRVGILSQYPVDIPNCQNGNLGMQYRLQIPEYGTIILDDCDDTVSVASNLYESLVDITYSIGAY